MKRAYESAEIFFGINFEAMNPNDGWVNPHFKSDEKVYNRASFGNQMVSVYKKVREMESRLPHISDKESQYIKAYHQVFYDQDFHIAEWMRYQTKDYGFGLRIQHHLRPDLFGILG